VDRIEEGCRMTPQQVEAWTLAVVERVTAGGRAEDERVECKSTWIEPAKAARRLAGHANAARGGTILWVMGLDEDGHRVSGVEDADLATWWPQVEKRFDQAISPTMRSFRVPTDSGLAVTAIVIETDRAPYVVRTDGQGGVDREVPFRVGTALRTAHRRELLQMVVPAAALPDVDIIEAEVRCQLARDRVRNVPEEEWPKYVAFRASGRAFFDAGSFTMLPSHLASLEVELSGAGGSTRVEMEELAFYRKHLGLPPGPQGLEEPHPNGVDARTSGVYVNGPGALEFNAMARSDEASMMLLKASRTALMSFNLGVARTDQFVKVQAGLTALKPTSRQITSREYASSASSWSPLFRASIVPGRRSHR
jgi:hypothetical protein